MSDPRSPERQVRYRWATRLAGGKRVLDAGCGRGWGTAALAESAATAVGVDLSPPAISVAQRDHGEVADFREGDIRDLPFDQHEFDMVVCFETIAHITETDQALGQLRRVLRPGGLLLVSSPNRGVYPAGNPLHLRELKSEELEAALSARFANVVVYRQQTYFASLLGSTEMQAHADSSTPLEVDVRKLSGGPPGTEVHAVAVASDGELPPPPANLALGSDVPYEEQERALRECGERAVKAEAALLAARRELRRADGGSAAQS